MQPIWFLEVIYVHGNSIKLQKNSLGSKKKKNLQFTLGPNLLSDFNLFFIFKIFFWPYPKEYFMISTNQPFFSFLPFGLRFKPSASSYYYHMRAALSLSSHLSSEFS
jgi:hypothetical protein